MTISEQAKRVELLYPQIELVWKTWWGAYWSGELRGFEGQPSFKVGILFTPFAPDPFALRYEGLRVKAWVIAPPLQNRVVDGVEIRPPHIWPQFNDAMCFYKPWDDGLDYDVDIPKTVIPWIIKWLAAYELWLATGVWVGPQAHPERAPSADAPSISTTETLDISRSMISIVRRWGTHGCGFIQLSASAGCYCWPWASQSIVAASALRAEIGDAIRLIDERAQETLEAA
jgi:hypothetical protein